MTDVALAPFLAFAAEGATYDAGDNLMFISLAGCSLDSKPGSNWVQEGGGLPEYICQVAKGIKKSGHDTSSAIRLAVGTVKNWASGQGKVNPDTRAKAAKAIAQWEALKAKAHAKSAAKKVAASNGEQHDLLALCADSFNIDAVRQAFDSQLADKMFPKEQRDDGRSYPRNYSYVEQLWTTFLIASGDLDGDGDRDYYKIPFNVDPEDTTKVTFGTPIEVRQEWVRAEDGGKVDGSDDLDGSDLDDDSLTDLAKLTAPASSDPLAPFLALSKEFPASDFGPAEKGQKCSRWGCTKPAVKSRKTGQGKMGACAEHAKEMTK